MPSRLGLTRGLALLLSLALVTAHLPARADAWDAAMARAAAAKENALDENDPARWEEALRLFREADAIRASKESKYEIASAAAWLKQDDLACEAYEGAIALGLDGPAKVKANTFLTEHAPKVARLRLRGPAGRRC